MIRHIGIISTIVSVFLAMKNTPESLEERRKFMNRIKELDPKLYRSVLLTTPAGVTYLPGKGGRFIALNGYRITQKIFKYN
jgi:hypothetical protein